MDKIPSFNITQDIREIEPTPDGYRQYEPIKGSIKVHNIKDKEIKNKMDKALNEPDYKKFAEILRQLYKGTTTMLGQTD